MRAVGRAIVRGAGRNADHVAEAELLCSDYWGNSNNVAWLSVMKLCKAYSD